MIEVAPCIGIFLGFLGSEVKRVFINLAHSFTEQGIKNDSQRFPTI